VNRERLVPPVPIHYFVREVGGRRVLEARVQRALQRPVVVHGLDGDVRVYVRERASSRPANEDEIRLLRRRPERVRIDSRMRRLLDAVCRLERPMIADVAKAARLGTRTARPLLQNLRRAGLIGQKDGCRLWITPSGYRVLEGI
jgi:predicted HTH transcriptional regulator